MLQRLVTAFASAGHEADLEDVISEALATTGALPHASDQAAAYTSLGRALTVSGHVVQAGRVLVAGQPAANAIATLDYYEAQSAFSTMRWPMRRT